MLFRSEWAELTKVPAAKVRPPRVGEAKAHLECKVMQIVDDNNTHIVLGRIVHAHVSKAVWKNGRIDPRLLDPACRLSGSAYAQLGEIVNVARPVWADLKGTPKGTAKMPRIVTLNNLALSTGKDGTLSLDAIAKTFRYLDQDELDAQSKARKKKKKEAKA